MIGRLARADQSGLEHPAVTLFRPALRRCLTQPRLPSAARVACVGDDPQPLVELLCGLGLEVVALCTRPEQVLDGRCGCPAADFQLLTAAERFAQSCDLVINLGLLPHTGNLLDSAARLATAQLLSLLKPLGRLVFLRRPPVRSDLGHVMDCWPRHLACFPGDITTETVGDSWLSPHTWNWIQGRTPRPATTLITLHAPLELLSLDDWRDYARRGLLTGQRACCDSAAALSTVRLKRAA